MSAADRWARQEGKPEPRTTAQLTSAELAARIHALREVLDLLWDVTAMTGGEPFHTIGRAKMELIALEAELRDRDRKAGLGEPLPLEVAFAVAAQSVRKGA